MKKLICIMMMAAIMLSMTIPAFAVNRVELEEQIKHCIEMKEAAHQMAECARTLGYAEDSIMVSSAKTNWADWNKLQTEYQSQLDQLNAIPQATWVGPRLTKSKGVNYGPIGKETYYNLNMSRVVSAMRNRGYDATNYPYWVRSDGCKMLGPYIIVAANLNHFPRGSIVECSLGMAIVCDTGHLGYNQLDIAVTW